MEHDHLVDIQGLCCSAPVLRLTAVLKEFGVGDVIQIVADKSSMLQDVPAYCKMKGHDLLHQETQGTQYLFWVRKC